jgi:predicted dinucleotide-utilizing enzyme
MAETDETRLTKFRSPRKRIRAVFIGWGAINTRAEPALAAAPAMIIASTSAFCDEALLARLVNVAQNANATVVTALAGVGLDKTRVEMVADPTVRINGHRITARGAFGRLELSLENNPLATNPKSSELTALSLVRLIEQQLHATSFNHVKRRVKSDDRTADSRMSFDSCFCRNR